MSNAPKPPGDPPPGAIHLGTFSIKGPGTFIGGVAKLSNDPEGDLLEAAESFLKAADRCLNGLKQDPNVEMLTVPGAMCAAFACELYLKYIHLKESGQPPRGHDLSELFHALDGRVRTALVASRADIAEVFERNRGQFTEVRYHHEKEQVSFRQQELLQLAQTLSSHIQHRYRGA